MFLQADYALESGNAKGAADVFRRHGDGIKDKQKAEILIADAKDLMSMYMAGDVKSVDQEIIHVTGVPPMRNPLFNKNTEEVAE